MIKTKEKHGTGEICNTQAQTAVNCITQHANAAIWEFNSSFKAMKALGLKDSNGSLLKPIKAKDLEGIVQMLWGARELGEGYKKLPWSWLLKPDSKERTNADVQAELNEANHVEWFQGQARYERWREEECLLPREMASVILDFNAQVTSWEQLSQSDNATLNPGYQAYCLCQRDARHPQHKREAYQVPQRT
ncbi:hypothetical protein FRC09_017832 [Ceratobasidium sp. 395]|nr:hypothetical protein FRC09_017832 [Ceratobasidium sp. 395]